MFVLYLFLFVREVFTTFVYHRFCVCRESCTAFFFVLREVCIAFFSRGLFTTFLVFLCLSAAFFVFRFSLLVYHLFLLLFFLRCSLRVFLVFHVVFATFSVCLLLLSCLLRFLIVYSFFYFYYNSYFPILFVFVLVVYYVLCVFCALFSTCFHVFLAQSRLSRVFVFVSVCFYLFFPELFTMFLFHVFRELFAAPLFVLELFTFVFVQLFFESRLPRCFLNCIFLVF